MTKWPIAGLSALMCDCIVLRPRNAYTLIDEGVGKAIEVKHSKAIVTSSRGKLVLDQKSANAFKF